LRDELGGADEEVNDGLGDQLDEVGDDLNDETFGDDNIGKKETKMEGRGMTFTRVVSMD
jgi:hypothetical protein